MLREALRKAAGEGAAFVLTPEVSNMISSSRAHQRAHLCTQDADPMLAMLREEAQALGVWVLAGSLAIALPDEERFANRSFLIDDQGAIRAQYDKIHMFDVTLENGETYRESAGFRPGDHAIVVDTPFGRIGMAICYDVRFPHLFREMAQAGAEIFTIPAAFSVPTGRAHWESLLRARAIENGAYVLAPAQTGTHPAQTGAPRKTYGHSMAVAPWGEVLMDAGTDVGIYYVDICLETVAKARGAVASLGHDRDFNLVIKDNPDG